MRLVETWTSPYLQDRQSITAAEMEQIEASAAVAELCFIFVP